MRSEKAYLVIGLSCFLSLPAWAGSTGGSGPPQYREVDHSDFEVLTRSIGSTVDEEFLTKEPSADGTHRSYRVLAGSKAEELILIDRREAARDGAHPQVLHILKQPE